ncbi:response regulator transcription factor [Rossellomorea aquimaris]|uniref:response regulator transcription factor n=1 Tax=Rossellomorea aquimaris TaxID=189382 RepID=UPI001CD1B92E|nr:response regulator transcription factor [Rossellomorea aquimaris]MCA1056535.1 response regulator transcription factor [Rossellomorea aquimaris]
MKILVVEDNMSVCSMIEMFLLKEGYESTFIHDGEEGYQQFQQGEWDLLILDWMLPGMDGVSLCRKIREKSSVPIIMLTAKDSESDQVIGLELGADDYVTKPFSPLALMARIKAVMRRTKRQGNEGVPQEFVKTKYFKLSKEAREVYIGDNLIPDLTPKEFDLLSHFIEHPKQVFSREQLLERVWGYQFYGDERTVDVHIKRLRKKLEYLLPSFIHTIWGVGYKFDETTADHEH